MAKELQNHDSQGQARVDALAIVRQSNQNAVRLGATIAKKEKIDGIPVVIKDTKELVYDEKTGEQKFYPDRWSITLEFNGGSLETEVSKDLFNSLQVGARYSAQGRIGFVKLYGKEQLLPVFDNFVFLYGNEDI